MILALQGLTVYLERNSTSRRFANTYCIEMWKRSTQTSCPLGHLKLPWAGPKGGWKWRYQEQKIPECKNIRQWLKHWAWTEVCLFVCGTVRNKARKIGKQAGVVPFPLCSRDVQHDIQAPCPGVSLLFPKDMLCPLPSFFTLHPSHGQAEPSSF